MQKHSKKWEGHVKNVCTWRDSKLDTWLEIGIVLNFLNLMAMQSSVYHHYSILSATGTVVAKTLSHFNHHNASVTLILISYASIFATEDEGVAIYRVGAKLHSSPRVP